MATYQHWKRAPGINQSTRPGSFWLFAEVDFKKYPALANDIYNILKIKAGWIIRESYYRIKLGSDLTADWEIGLAGGTEIKDVSDTSTTSTAWAAGSYTSAAPYLNASDQYITVQVTSAAETKGCLQVMLEIIAAPDNAEPVDADIT